MDRMVLDQQPLLEGPPEYGAVRAREAFRGVMCQLVTWPPFAHPPRTWRIM